MLEFDSFAENTQFNENFEVRLGNRDICGFPATILYSPSVMMVFYIFLTIITSFTRINRRNETFDSHAIDENVAREKALGEPVIWQLETMSNDLKSVRFKTRESGEHFRKFKRPASVGKKRKLVRSNRNSNQNFRSKGKSPSKNQLREVSVI